MNHDMRDMTNDDLPASIASGGRSSIPDAQTMSAGRVISRRYILLKGVGRGSAILAAAVPIKTLASVPSVTITGEICSVSGTQSVVHSQPKGLPQCAGSQPAKYANPSNWPPYTVNGKPLGNSTNFNDVFGGTNTSKLAAIMDPKNPDSPERHWTTAWFNAIKAPASPVFPYTAPEVLGLYSDVTKRAAALAFFTNFMETLT